MSQTLSVPLIIRPLVRQDLAALIAHTERVTRESGQGGNPIFAPYDSRSPWNKVEAEKNIAKSWVVPITEPNWQRDWGLFQEEKIVGNIDLRGSNIHTGLHRTQLGIGIELAFQGQGFGMGLMSMALTWAKQQTILEWVDLEVFAGNIRAIKMYERLGFQQIGYCADRFRLLGQSIDDIKMTLKLKPNPAGGV
jgi:RimJ/RimL family protein N-acetyltransferase